MSSLLLLSKFCCCYYWIFFIFSFHFFPFPTPQAFLLHPWHLFLRLQNDIRTLKLLFFLPLPSQESPTPWLAKTTPCKTWASSPVPSLGSSSWSMNGKKRLEHVSRCGSQPWRCGVKKRTFGTCCRRWPRAACRTASPPACTCVRTPSVAHRWLLPGAWSAPGGSSLPQRLGHFTSWLTQHVNWGGLQVFTLKWTGTLRPAAAGPAARPT